MNMKTIVTHLSPDLDAIASTWLVKKYLPGWNEAQVAFVPINKTLNEMQPDENPEIIHVDTGFGKFDHHHRNEYLSATKLVFEYLKEEGNIGKRDYPALERIVKYVNDIDNFAERLFPEPASDVYDFAVHQLTIGLKARLQDDIAMVDFVSTILEAMLLVMKNKVKAEEELKNGFVFTSRWGKTIAMESKNEEALKLGLKIGYDIVLRKDPVTGYLKVKALPEKKNDLTELYEKLKKADNSATWFLHATKYIIINGTVSNPHAIATRLDLPKVIEIIKEID